MPLRSHREGRGASTLIALVTFVLLFATGACGAVMKPNEPLVPQACQRGSTGLSGSFVQLSTRDFRADASTVGHDVALMRSIGIETLVIQFTGDERGPFDQQHSDTRPVRRLVIAAAAAGISVWLGLHADPSWPNAFDAATRVAPPLDNVAWTDALVGLCHENPTCLGFYLSPELDDARGPSDAPRIEAFVRRMSEHLRARAPDKRIAIAPFFTGLWSPADHAALWQPVLSKRLVDVFMLQDGVGTGRATPKLARRYLEALRATLPAPAEPAARSVALWSVVELFEQLAGPPHDDRPFAARPANFDVVASSLRKEGAAADRLIAFSVLDYMDPRREHRAAGLYADYRSWCQRRPVGAPAALPDPFPNAGAKMP